MRHSTHLRKLFVLILFLTLSYPTFSQVVDNSSANLVTVTPKNYDPAKEVVSLRDFYTKHYRKDDGTFTAVISAVPVHYKSGNQFLDINTNIVSNPVMMAAGVNYPYINTTNLMQSYFADHSSDGLASVTAQGTIKEFLNTRMYWEKNGNASAEKSSSDAAAFVNGNTITYGNLYSGIDAQFSIEAGKRELNYIINDKNALSAAPAGAGYLVFAEDIELEQGWSYEMTAKGILIKDASGKTVGRYENPVIREGFGKNDAAPRVNSSEISEMNVVKNGNMLTVLTKVKAEWLNDGSRIFPIAVDPTFTISTPTEFGYTNSNGSDAGYDEVDFGRYNSLWYLGYASFDISTWNNALWTATKVSIGGISVTTGGTIHNLATMSLLRVTVYPGNYSTWASFYTAVNGMAAYAAYAKGSWTGTKDLGAAAVTQFGVDYASSYKWFTVGFKATGSWNNNSYAAINGAPLQLLVDYTVNGSCVAGTASPASQFVFTNGTANMTLSGYTAPGGIQWEYSPNGVSGWVNVSGGSGATTDNYTTASLANGSYYYRARVTDGGSCTQYSGNVYVIVAATPPYCSGVGSGNPVQNNHIDGILFHEFNQQPGWQNLNYVDYTDTTTYGKATVVAGQYHHFGATIRAQGAGVSSTTVAAWIDFNFDGVFNNTPFSSGGERIDIQNFTSNVSNTYAAYLTIPANAHIGATRMRVRAVRGSFADLDPCATYTYSQTKDLTVVVRPSIGNQPCVTPPSNVNGTVDVVKANSTSDKVYIQRVKVDGPSGTVMDNNSQYFGVQSGNTLTMYNYSNMMGYYSRGLTLEAGQTYTATIEHSGYTTIAGLFIDWNGDGDFSDTGEIVGRDDDPNKNPFVFSFTVPQNVVSGKQVVMRVRLRYNDGGNTYSAANMTGCNNLTSDGLQQYSEVEDYRATLLTVPLVCAPVSNITASIGTPANGTAHHLNVSWNAIPGATAYNVEYSTNGVSYISAATVNTPSYDFNAGDNPNVSYWFRVRATDGNQTCAWGTMATPRYTACDVPAVPTVNNIKTNSVDVTLAAETPVANPAITTYSIYCATTSQYVQADGTLGATEVFRTKAQWGTITVTGLSMNTQYCFNAKAKNADGDERGGIVGVTSVEPFESDVINNQSSPPTNVWGSPGTCNSGGWFDFAASTGCGGSGGAKFTKTTDNFYLGCFLRTPIFNATGMNSITVSFDITNHLDAQDNIDFSCWSVGDNKYDGSTTTINGVAATKLYFNAARNCTRITVEYSLTGFTNKSQMMFYINNNGDNDNGTYNLVIDNFSVNTLAPTTCNTTLNCVDPSANAGTAVEVCSNGGAVNVTAGATASNYADVNWTSSGTGSWTNQTSLTQASYTPSGADITAGSVTLTLTANNGGCTPAVSTKTLTINLAPVPSFVTVANPVCLGYTGNTYSTQAGFNNYVWSVDGGSITSGGGSSDNTATVTWNVTGTKSISVNYTDANNCTASAPVVQNVTVNPLPVVSVSPTAAVCTGTTHSTLTATVDNGSTYVWSPNLHVVSTGGVSNVPITVEISQLTFYTVTGTTALGCTAAKVVPVATVPVGGAVTPRYSIICSGGSKVLTADSTAGNSYHWQKSTDNLNWSDINGATNTSYTASPVTDTYYRLMARSNACWDVTSNTVLVNISKPDITLTVTGKTDNNIVLNWAPAGGANYNIAYDGTSSGNASNVTPPYTLSGLTASGSYNITVTQTGAGLNGCPASGDTSGVTTFCSVPTGVTASSPVNKQLKVDWSGDAGNYRVYYRAVTIHTSYSYKDVTTVGNSGTVTITTGLYGGTPYEVYVVRKDCPSQGIFGQKSALAYTTVMPLSACTPAPNNITVNSTCPGQIEVSMSGSPTGNYTVLIQRLTPTIAGGYKYNVTGNTFQVHVGQPGQTFMVGVASKCVTGTSDWVMYPGGITIKPLCNPIGNLVLSNPTCSGFTGSWNREICSENTVATYQFFMKRTGTLNWNSYPVNSQPSPFSPYLKVSWLGKGYEMSCYVKANYTCNGYVIGGPSSSVQTITTLSSGCREEEQNILTPETPSTQIISPDQSEAISIYPNPNSGQFQLDISRLSIDAVQVRVEVMNVLGQTVLTRISEAADGHGNENINLPESCTAGTYFVRVTVGSNVYTAKVNVNK